MQSEPTTLSDVVRLIQEVLRDHYQVDPAPLLKQANIDPVRAESSGARIVRAKVMRLWELAAEATGDAAVGLVVGSRIRATSFYALGLAFMTCNTIRESLDLLIRYYKVIVTVPLEMELVDEGAKTRLTMRYSDPDYPLPPIPFDSFIAAVIGLCRIAVSEKFSPVELHLRLPDNGRRMSYEKLFNAPVVFDKPINALVFEREDLEQPLPGRSSALLHASDKVLEEYLEALNPSAVSTEVRKLLLGLLPRGKASQDEVAAQMFMSRSTLQRRLREENTNYRDILESTRRSLAIEYVREGEHSLSYIAFLLGFSDQSNFSRAFRRWTGASPKAFRAR